MTISTDQQGSRSQTPLSHRAVVAQLAGAQKSAKGAPAYSRFVNRPLGRQFAALAFRAGRTPNQVTVLSGVLSFAGIATIALVSPSWWSGLLVGVLLVLGYALDAADGQLARLRGGGSYAGEWLDHMVDAAKIVCLHLAVLIGLYRFTDLAGSGWLLVPVGFTVVACVSFFGMILNDQLRRGLAAATGVTVDRGHTSPLRSLLVIPTDYGLLCVVFLTFGLTDVFFPVYTFLAAYSALYLGAAAVKWYREMSRLTPGKAVS
ncbi:CDP-alcohol phosphatidyltransferase family protein [Nakamurella sp. A5-74]|uniref:CDP-alcohol phosphatidyltransferase family protein n=1 Tax=Nakamurella sp. A5-74 TaxID=3158264 RepID=A0AAU8DNY5_9ACTN